MHRMNCFDAFHFNYDQAFDNQINSISQLNLFTVINDR